MPRERQMPDTRLIERWLPIAALGEESARERRSMTALPPTYYLHVWWARRPLVASRAAVLASLLPADADREKFLHTLGIHGDPVGTRRKLDAAKISGENLGPNPYGYKRAFCHVPENSLNGVTVLDPTAGGGSIPFESVRLGLGTVANDLNPVAVLIERATIEWPVKYGSALVEEFKGLAAEFVRRAELKYQGVFPAEPENNRVEGYLWARTITCPYCAGLIPLSPNWKLAKDGTGVRLKPEPGGGPGAAGRVCRFEIVESVAEQSPGTVVRGTGVCPYPDCGRVIDGAEIKRQAQEGGMGEQLYAVVYKRRVPVILDKWVRGYRAPRPEDDNSADVARRLAGKLPEWEARDMVPRERFPEDSNDTRPIQYGMPLWRDMFSPRQLLCHGTSVEVFREMLEAEGELSDLRRAAYAYLALVLDKLLNFNSRMSRWQAGREVVTSTFDRHDFSFKWSYAEMAPLITGLGYDWAIRQVAKCIDELVSLVRPEAGGDDGLFPAQSLPPPPPRSPSPASQGTAWTTLRMAASTRLSWIRRIMTTSCMPSSRIFSMSGSNARLDMSFPICFAGT